MKRHILPWATFVVALCLALPATAGNGRSVKGMIAAISADAVAVKSPSSVITTCARTHVSPSLNGYAGGDRVQMVCRGRKGRLVLTRIRHLQPIPISPKNDAEPTYFGGAITALSDDSITLHDGDRDLTCAIDSSSPSTADFKLGQHAKVKCVGGDLVAIAPVTAGDVGRYFVGVVNALDSLSLTLQTEHGLVTCTIAAGSPSTAELNVGDRVGMGCKASTMQLVLIRKLDGEGTPTPPAPTTHVTTGARGAVSSLSTTSLSVLTDGGTVTCQIGSTSPGLGELHVGDRVAMTCVDGVLSALERVT
jgi:hypothetical protein